MSFETILRLVLLLACLLMAWLVLFNAKKPLVTGFWLPFAMDLTVVLYAIGNFSYCGYDRPLRGERSRPA